MIPPFPRRLAEEERGSVFVAGAVAILVFAMLGGAVIEVGQWYQHRRSLQVRTDAAALAAGQALNACFNLRSAQFPTEQAADTFIENWAKNYGGFTSAASTQNGAPYNRQFGTGSTYMSFQSDTFPSASTPQPTPQNIGPECFNADGSPNMTVDVRTTQSGISPFLSFSPFATVHGWARVELQVIKALRPAMPLAIPDVNPKHVAVTFVDSNGQALTGCTNPTIAPCTFALAGPTNSVSINVWSGPASIPVPAADQNVGMRVSIGPQNGNCAGVSATSTYTCYDYGSTSTGILSVRSYSTATIAVGATAPSLRSVTPVTCLPTNLPGGTPYFSAYQAAGGTCDQVGVNAVVTFPAGATSQSVFEDITQAKKCNATTSMSQAGTTWSSPLSSLPIGNGAYKVCLSWSYKSGKNTLTGDFNGGNPVQEIYSGSDGSDPALPGGPIMAASLLNTSDGSPGYSQPAGGTANVTVTLGLTGGVHVNPKCSNTGGNSGKKYDTPPGCPSDPPILLRTANSSGSLNYAIDCGVIPGTNGGNLYRMMRYGCNNSFSINQQDICPDPLAPNPTSCAPVLTGDKTGQVRQALNDRMTANFGNGCAPNNYPDTTVANDPRIVLLVDTDFSAYLGNQGGSSSSDVPVVTFATFYVTGWDGASGSCAALNGPAPPNSDSKGNSSNLWGHFIAYETNGTPSGVKCAANSLAPCVGALVR